MTCRVVKYFADILMALQYSETSVTIYKTKRRNIPEDFNP
jgi:hypothetical protein